jgi:hypothetical protein
MNYRKQILQNGYVIVEHVFSQIEINTYREKVLESKNLGIKSSSGTSIPDFIKDESLKLLGDMKDNSKLKQVLDEIFDGNNYRFCSHNDIGINRIVGWHKDKLNNSYSRFETVDIWSSIEDEKHEILKVLIYLEDHSNDNDGLKIVPKSHLDREIETTKFVQLKPKIGDVIIFDQRITHRGMSKQVIHPRILVSFGFGRNNIFTDNFEKGTIKRQNDQNKNI